MTDGDRDDDYDHDEDEDVLQVHLGETAGAQEPVDLLTRCPVREAVTESTAAIDQFTVGFAMPLVAGVSTGHRVRRRIRHPAPSGE